MNHLIVTDSALTDVDALVAAAADYLSRRLGGAPPLDPAALPTDAPGALAAIDGWAGSEVANWRSELTRWFEAHAPVHLVPDPDLNGLLRRASRSGCRLACASSLPPEALELMLQQLGCARAFNAVAAGDGSLDDAVGACRAALGDDVTAVVSTREALVTALTPA